MTDVPSITVILLNFRDAERSTACVESALAGGAACVLVWDNSEDSGLSARSIRQRLPDSERVLIRISSCNLGFAAGVNAAIELVCRERPGDWILVINNDATLRFGALEKLRSCLSSDTGVQMAVPAIQHSNGAEGPSFYHRWTGLMGCSSRPGSFSFPSGCCFAIAPERCSLPIYDERFFMYGEDWALGARLERGSVCYIPDVLVDHEGSVSSGLGSRFYEERMVAAHLLIVSVLAKGGTRWVLMLLVRLPFLCLRALVRSYRFRSLLPLKALFWGAIIASGRDPLRHRAASVRGRPEASQQLP